MQLGCMQWLHVNQLDSSKQWLGKRTCSARIPVGHYHTMPLPRGNLYQAVRKRLGMPRSAFAKLIRISEYQLRYRERVKRTYHLCEVMALFVASGITWDQYGELLNDIA